MKTLWFLALLTMLCSCQRQVEEPLFAGELMEIPQGFPIMEFPADNAFTLERWGLGKRLFFDQVMSIDSSISCASCHAPQLAFGDDRKISPGVEGRLGERNSPSLANIGFHPYFTREGGVATLEMQVFIPIQEHAEFDFNIVSLAERLNTDSTYVKLAYDAYDRPPDPFVITRALATFQRSLISGYSPYDQYAQSKALNAEEKLGMELFFGNRTNCSSCHGGFNFTNYAFENNGLYAEYSDPGRFRLTRNEADRALFKVPSLRNVALTPPYMHDGSLADLAAVVRHYNSGGSAHPQKNELVHPLHLTQAEQAALVRFLQSLTDEEFIRNPLFRF